MHCHLRPTDAMPLRTENFGASGHQQLIVRPSGRGTVHWRPHKIFLHFHDLSTILNKIREGVALSPLSILHKTHLYAN